MPIGPTSRYGRLGIYPATDAPGVARASIPARPHRPPPPSVPRYQHQITGVETIEDLAWRYYGSSADWWRIADANPLRFPLDWRPPASLQIAAADDPGRLVRDRRF